jgi:hypothetical protein
MSNQRQGWDLGRFVQTLAYFESIPVVSDIQRMFQPQQPPPSPSVIVQANGNSVVFDFVNGNANQDLAQTWGAVDDVVMGGVSNSQVVASPQGAIFTGNVSTDNSGGFASVRTRNFEPALNWGRYSGVELNVRGDGQRYKFLLRSDLGWDSVAFAHSFDTIAGQWTTVKIPFSTLIPVFRAKTLPDTVINPASIRSVQLMLSKFEYDRALNPKFTAGKFELIISSIGLY